MEVVGQAGPLTLGPPLELHGSGEGEAAEEGTGVDGDGGDEVAARERAP